MARLSLHFPFGGSRPRTPSNDDATPCPSQTALPKPQERLSKPAHAASATATVATAGTQAQLPSFTALPLEIIYAITDHMDPVSMICLSATCRLVYSALGPRVDKIKQGPEHEFSRCAKWLVMVLFERDQPAPALGTRRRRSARQIPAEKLTCALCKVKLAPECFEPRDRRSVVERIIGRRRGSMTTNHQGFQHLRMLSRPDPLTRFCDRHIAKIFLGGWQLESMARAAMHGECKARPMCLHCGGIISPASSASDDDDMKFETWARAANIFCSCPCACDFCPRDVPVPSFIIYRLYRCELDEDSRNKVGKYYFVRFERKGERLFVVDGIFNTEQKTLVDEGRYPVVYR